MLSFLYRQSGLLPCRQPAGEIDDAAEAELAQRRGGLGGALAAVAIDDHRLVLALGKVARALQARERHVLRAEDVTRAVFAGFPHVEHQRVLAVDEMRRLRGA